MMMALLFPSSADSAGTVTAAASRDGRNGAST